MVKMLIVGVIIVVLAGGAFFVWKIQKPATPKTPLETVSTTTITKVGNPKGTPPATSTPVNSSDQSLDQSFNTVQGNLNKLNTDQNNAIQDSSSKDTPGNY